MTNNLLKLPSETFSFDLLDYEIEHQNGAVLDIFVELDYKEGIGEDNPFAYAEFVSIANFIDDFLVNYPNETDFWEILNKNLVETLLTETIPTDFGVEYHLDELLDSLSVDIQVQSGSSGIDIPRASEVTGIPTTKRIKFEEAFSFNLLDYEIEHQNGAILDIFVDLDYKKGIGAKDPFAYAEFVSIANFIDDFLVNYPNETDFWEILNKNLVETLLTETIPTNFGVEYHLDELLDSLSVDIQVQAGSSGIDIPRASEVTGITKAQRIKFEEAFSFDLLDYEIEHQNGAILDIFVDLDYKEEIVEEDPLAYAEFVSIANFIDGFLVNYPNETDFWEILNKNLVETLLTETIPTNFGVEYHLDELLDSLSVDIQVQAGSSGIDIPRASEVTGIPKGQKVNFEEAFSFNLLDYEIEHQNGAVLDIFVELDYKEKVVEKDPLAYAEFVSIANFIDDFLVNYPNETDFWEILNKNLVETLLTETIPTNFGVEYHLDELLDSLSVDIQVQAGSSGIDIPRSSKVVQTVKNSPSPPSQVFGTAGADEFDSENPGSSGFIGKNQILFTDSGNDTVDVSLASGGNQINLSNGDDLLFAGSNNRILAGSGDDRIFLGYPQGNNVVKGGRGADQFWIVTDTMNLPSQANIITDYKPGIDVLGFEETGLTFDDLNLTQNGADTVINLLGEDLAILQNVQVSSLSDANFVFI